MTRPIPPNPGSLLIGCGVVGEVHARALAELALQERAHLAGVVDSDRARAERFGQVWGVRATSSLDEALSWPGVHLVQVCTPSGLHATVGVQAARAGKHVLVEKPIDVALEAADRLIAVCDDAGVALGVVSQHRFDPGFKELQQLVESGVLGRLVLGEARVKWWRSDDYYADASWRGSKALDGGGALINQAIHYVDLLLALCGPVERVSAYTATLAHTLEVEDIAAAVLRFRGGAIGTILASTAIFPGLSERLEINGVDGSAIIEDGTLIYAATRDAIGPVGSHGLPWEGATRTRAGASPHAPPYGGRHTDQIADFVDAVVQGRTPTVTGADGRAALAAVTAIYEAAETGHEVALPW